MNHRALCLKACKRKAGLQLLGKLLVVSILHALCILMQNRCPREQAVQLCLFSSVPFYLTSALSTGSFSASLPL